MKENGYSLLEEKVSGLILTITADSMTAKK